MKYLLDTDICLYLLKVQFGLTEKVDQVGFEYPFISEITVAKLKFGVEKVILPTKTA